MTQQETFNTLTTIRYRRMMIEHLMNTQGFEWSELANKPNLELEDLIEKKDKSLVPMLKSFNINMELPKCTN